VPSVYFAGVCDDPEPAPKCEYLPWLADGCVRHAPRLQWSHVPSAHGNGGGGRLYVPYFLLRLSLRPRWDLAPERLGVNLRHRRDDDVLPDCLEHTLHLAL
jgi:hypothetical protein